MSVYPIVDTGSTQGLFIHTRRTLVARLVFIVLFQNMTVGSRLP